MAASQQGSDRIISTDSNKLMKVSTLDEKEEPVNSDDLEEHDATTIGPPRDVTSQSGSVSAVGDYGAVYPPNVYAPQEQTFYYGGYENTTSEWGEYRQYVAAENLEIGSPGIYNDNPALVFHTGYGYNPQMPYGPYSPVTTPLSSVRGDGQLYSPQQFPFSGPSYYHQPVPLSMQYIASTPVSQTEPTMSVSIDQRGDGMLFGPTPSHPSQFGSSDKGGSFPGNSGNPSFYELPQGFDGFGPSGPWSDWSKSPDGQRSLTPLSSPAASPQPISMLGSFGHNAGMASQQKRPLYGFGPGSSSYSRGYPHSGIYQSSSFGSASISSLGMNDRWLAVDKARLRGRDIGSLCSCNGTLDILSEQNRGPRASKLKSQTTTEHGSSVDSSKNDTSTAEARGEPYNQPDFVTEYKDAKFFVIKSYSEDNVHKSIKYGVWASTPNGNRKLDAAYREVKEKEVACPIFLLFSVNASAQFCGVSEMVGSVDFEKSVDYWQQDKWSGQFPVKWHIIKDVPNSQFRHIILENNDNKPVTNSRDTQEVKLEQGLEMLKIFKDYETDLSILDDFDFYEERQKVMQERKSRQHASSMTAPIVGDIEQRNPVSLPSDFIKQMSKSFAQAVRMEDKSKEDTTDKGGTGAPPLNG